MKTTKAAALIAASVLALGAAPRALAQDTATTTADPATDTNADIIVTAQRRSESVIEVPISITVADQKQLERQQVYTVNDLNRIAPSLEIQSAPGQNTGGGGQIRGVGTQTFAAGAAASVGIIVDQISQGNANVADLFDIARVEVLKGPQGTLFGLTTSAGAINITTNAPDPTGFSARARAELSDAGTAGAKFGNQVLQGVVNVPIASNAALRLSGNVNLRQGVNYNRSVNDYTDINRYVLRGRLLWKASDALTFNLIADYNRSKTTYGGDFFTYLRAPTAIATALARCGIVAGSGNQDICTTLNPNDKARSYGGSLQIDLDAGPVTVTSITAGRRRKSDPSGVGTINRVDTLSTQLYSGPSQGGRGSLFTQELRVTSPSSERFEYTAGFFYSRQTSDGTPSAFRIVANPAPGVFIPIVNDPGRTTQVNDKSWAAFGNGTLHLTDKFQLIAGLRYTETYLSLEQTPLGGTRSDSLQEAENVSYKAGAQYQFSPTSMAYATVARGFKGGQISIPTGAAPIVLLPEKPMSYEIGYKSNLLGGWVLDLNAFYQKFDNFQAQACSVNPATSQLLCVQTNLPNIKSRGAEASLFGNITRNLNVSTGFIYAKTTYPKNFLGDDRTNIGGTQLAYAPRYKFTFSGEYNQELSGGLKGFVAGDAVWKSRIRYQANSNRDVQFGAHWSVGGRLGLRTADDRYSAGVFVRNLFNVHEPSLFLASGGELLALYNTQSFRQVGLSLDARF